MAQAIYRWRPGVGGAACFAVPLFVSLIVRSVYGWQYTRVTDVELDLAQAMSLKLRATYPGGSKSARIQNTDAVWC